MTIITTGKGRLTSVVRLPIGRVMPAEGEPARTAAATHPGAPAVGRHRVAAPRLARHVLRLSDGHRVGVAVAGRGIPLVVVHGYSAEGVLYAQTLSRLVSMGFKVIAVDTAGHGATAELRGGGNLRAYAELLGRIVDHLGIKRAVFAGHSMGGRLVTELAAHRPDRAIAVILLDAIVGDTWDGMVQLYRLAPPTLALTGAALIVDSASTVPLVQNPRQAVKLGRLALPTYLRHIIRPWRLLTPAVSILRSGGSRWMLDRLRQEEVPVIVIHGERDLIVPLQTARDTVARTRGTLVVVKGAPHSWPLRDPETLPGIVAELLHRELGDAYQGAVAAAGLDPATATVDEIERGLYEPDARVLDLSPPLEFDPTNLRRGRPRYRWTYDRR